MAAFWFHYNKPASASKGHPVMTVHYKGQCLLVRRVVCTVPLRSRERATQPRMVMCGTGVVRIADDTAHITSA